MMNQDLKFVDKRKMTMIMNLARNDFKNKYSGSVFGVFWGFAPPIVTILVYGFVFHIGFHIRPMGNVPYLFWLVTGLVPWFFFSDSIVAVTNCFTEYSYLVKKVVFDIRMIPYVKLISSLVIHFFFLILLLYIGLLYGYIPGWYHLQLLYYTAALICLILSAGFITAVFNVFFKDISQIIMLFLQFGIWLVPIMWNTTMFSEKWIFILKFNPLFYIIQGYRDSLIYHVPVYAHTVHTVYFWCCILILALSGRYLFRKLNVHFADLL